MVFAFEYELISLRFSLSLPSAAFYENRLKIKFRLRCNFIPVSRRILHSRRLGVSLRPFFYCHLRLFAAIIFLEIILLILFCHKRKDFIIYVI